MKIRENELDRVRKVAGKSRKIDGVLQARRGNKKYSNYAIYLLDDDSTVYVNLDGGEDHLSETPNKKAIKAFRQKEQRKLDRQADREQEQKERAAKPKAEPKAKAPAKPKAEPKVKKAEPTGQQGWSDEEWARIQAIMAEKKCTRKNAIRQMRNEQAIKAADAQATRKPVDPLAKATVVSQ